VLAVTDSISGYSPGVRNIFEASVNAPRYLLTYENAGHNAGAPIPSPKEMFGMKCGDGTWTCSEHYTDPVWDNVRMNNIAQHFVTAFLAKHLRNDASIDLTQINTKSAERKTAKSVVAGMRIVSTPEAWAKSSCKPWLSMACTCAGLPISVTRCPARASMAPKKLPTAPAPTTTMCFK